MKTMSQKTRIIVMSVITFILILLITLLYFAMQQQDSTKKEEPVYKNKTEEKAAMLAKKSFEQDGYMYKVKSKNADGTYTISVIAEDDNKETCYYVVNATTNTAQQYVARSVTIGGAGLKIKE